MFLYRERERVKTVRKPELTDVFKAAAQGQCREVLVVPKTSTETVTSKQHTQSITLN